MWNNPFGSVEPTNLEEALKLISEIKEDLQVTDEDYLAAARVGTQLWKNPHFQSLHELCGTRTSNIQDRQLFIDDLVSPFGDSFKLCMRYGMYHLHKIVRNTALPGIRRLNEQNEMDDQSGKLQQRKKKNRTLCMECERPTDYFCLQCYWFRLQPTIPGICAKHDRVKCSERHIKHLNAPLRKLSAEDLEFERVWNQIDHSEVDVADDNVDDRRTAVDDDVDLEDYQG